MKKTVKKRETDSSFFLKIVMYFIFGTLWLSLFFGDFHLPLPIGFIIGMAFATHDHFQIDRKLEYAVLIVAMFLGYVISPRFLLMI